MVNNVSSSKSAVRKIYLLSFCLLAASLSYEQDLNQGKLVAVDSGWASNSINAVVFRKNALVSHGKWQYIAFYNKDGNVVLGKRKRKKTHWQLKTTAFTGNIKDAHNCISIMTDGKGYLHLAFDHHNNQLHYSRSIKPGSLEMTEEMPMTGIGESAVSYPEFYYMANGDLLFLYRDGGSGHGNLVMNYYDCSVMQWKQLHNNLVDGEGIRNAYWQACTDTKGNIHLSWVWRESPDVASNHDLCYARSDDGGVSWKKSDGTVYKLPITAANAEYAWHIPQKSELINQTSMVADHNGNPFVATYWRDVNDSVPQYRVLFNKNGIWQLNNTAFRTTAFSLSGAGTKSIPVARPQLLVTSTDSISKAILLYRDEERGRKISIASTGNIISGNWKIADATGFPVGAWEPSYDTELWKNKKQVHVYVQAVQQIDAEGLIAAAATMVYVLEWKPQKAND